MVNITSLVIALLVTIFIFIISSLPLYFAVRFLGGKTSILKAVIINLLAGFVVWLVNEEFRTFGSIMALVLLIWIYREFFKLKWIKAILVWVLQVFLIIVFEFIIGTALALLGISFVRIFF